MASGSSKQSQKAHVFYRLFCSDVINICFMRLVVGINDTVTTLGAPSLVNGLMHFNLSYTLNIIVQEQLVYHMIYN